MDRTTQAPVMNRPQQAVVLAAGRGSRMGHFTDDQPKCLHPLAGRPILEWTLQALKASGITKVLVIGGWQATALQPWCDVLRVHPRWAQTNMVRSLMLAADWLQQAPTLVVYGDGAYGARALSAALGESPNDVVVPVDTCWLALWSRRFANPLEDAETLVRDGRRILSIGQRPRSLEEVQAQFMGLLRLTPQGWGQLQQRIHHIAADRGEAAVERLDMTGLLSAFVTGGGTLHAVDVPGGWVEIDSQNDVAAVERALLAPEFSHDFRV